MEKLFKRNLPRDKRKMKLRLDDALLGCFSNLSPKCRDEELEDLVYFILDLYQFHGVPIAISEVDMDQITVDLRTALEEHVAARKKARVMPVEDGHTFLVLDRSLQSIPWESLPVLRGQSVSRIPSLEFLLDRVRLAAMEREGAREDGDGVIDRIRVDARKTYYVLNPGGDLKGTEGRFSSWLKEMHGVGWQGITGRAPSEQELLNALSRKDLVMYVQRFCAAHIDLTWYLAISDMVGESSMHGHTRLDICHVAQRPCSGGVLRVRYGRWVSSTGSERRTIIWWQDGACLGFTDRSSMAR